MQRVDWAGRADPISEALRATRFRASRWPHSPLSRRRLSRILSLGTTGHLERWRASIAAAWAIELDRGILSLCVPVLIGLGVIGYFAFPDEPGWLPLTGAACAGTAFALLPARRGVTLSGCAVLLIAGGALAGKFETARMSTRMLGSAVTARLTAKVVEVAPMASGRTRLLLDVLKTERPQLRFSPNRVRLTAGGIAGQVAAGDVVEGLARLMPPPGPVMPGGYDFSFESYFDGIGATGFLLGKPDIERAGHGGASDLSAWIENARDRVAGHIRAEIGGAEGEIAAALIVGTRGGIPDEVNEALRRTGLAHILSISGLHMALVAATVMGVLRGIAAAFPTLASRRPVKKYAAATALAAVSGYVLFSGSDVAAVRSFVMLAIMLAAVLLDRAALTMRNLAIAACLILLWSPHELLGPSFQMSFAATAALIGAYAAWADRRPERKARNRTATPWRWAAGRGAALILALAATSLIAGAATTGFAAYHFHRISPLSLPANLLVMPIVSILVMPPALAAMIAMPMGLDGPFLAIMGLGLKLMLAVATWLSAHSPLDAVGWIPRGSMLLAAAAVVVLAVTSTWLRLLALPLVLASFVAAGWRATPVVFVAEDARLVGVPTADGELAVSTQRGGGFTLQNWQRATASSLIRRPAEDPAANPARAAASPGAHRSKIFSCADGLCISRMAGGIVAHAAGAQAAERACRVASVLVLDYALASRPCGRGGRRPLIITQRELALRGSATLWPRAAGTRSPLTAIFAIPEPLRPWHEHRRYSRAARGLEDHGKVQGRQNPKGDKAHP